MHTPAFVNEEGMDSCVGVCEGVQCAKMKLILPMLLLLQWQSGWPYVINALLQTVRTLIHLRDTSSVS